MNLIIDYLKKLSFWPFIGIFTVVAVVFAELLIIIQSYFMHGRIKEDYLQIGFVSAVIVSFMLLLLIASILEQYVHQENDLQLIQKHLKDAQRVAQFYDWELDLVTGKASWSVEIHELLGTDPAAEVGPELLSSLVDSRDWPKVEKSLKTAMREGTRHEQQYRVNLKDGSTRWIYCMGESQYNEEGKPQKITGVVQDITDRKNDEERIRQSKEEAQQAVEKLVESNLQLETEMAQRKQIQERLHFVAMYDQLTELPNRLFLKEEAQKIMARCKSNDQKMGLIFMDINNFKLINEKFGHDIGDATIVQIALLIKDALRKDDTLGRFGGDKFIALIPDINSTDYLHNVIQRILVITEQPLDLVDNLTPDLNIGTSIFPDSSESYDNLVFIADKAMQDAMKTTQKKSVVTELELSAAIDEPRLKQLQGTSD